MPSYEYGKSARLKNTDSALCQFDIASVLVGNAYKALEQVVTANVLRFGLMRLFVS